MFLKLYEKTDRKRQDVLQSFATKSFACVLRSNIYHLL